MRTLKNKKSPREFKVQKLTILSVKSGNNPDGAGAVSFIGRCNKADFKAALHDFSKNKKTIIFSLPHKEYFWTNGKIASFFDDDETMDVVAPRKLSAIINGLVKK